MLSLGKFSPGFIFIVFKMFSNPIIKNGGAQKNLKNNRTNKNNCQLCSLFDLRESDREFARQQSQTRDKNQENITEYDTKKNPCENFPRDSLSKSSSRKIVNIRYIKIYNNNYLTLLVNVNSLKFLCKTCIPTG